jgi:hypothetical protein
MLQGSGHEEVSGAAPHLLWRCVLDDLLAPLVVNLLTGSEPFPRKVYPRP